MTPEQIAAIAGKLTKAQRAVMLEMSNGEYVERASFLAADAGVPLNETREILRKFRQDRLATHGTLWNEDEAAPAGSGTWLTPLGLAVRDYLEKEPRP